MIIPTILAHNKKEFSDYFEKLIKISENIQIDFMDGKFVPEKSVLISQIPDLKKYKNNFEAHLMIKNPLARISALKEKGFRKIIFHYESLIIEKKILKVIETIRKNKLICYIAINPETSVEKIYPYLEKIDGVLLMGVQPGKSGQEFIPQVLTKTKSLRRLNSKIKIQVDGGVDLEVAAKLANAEVDYLNSGSFVSDSDNPRVALSELNKIFKKQ